MIRQTEARSRHADSLAGFIERMAPHAEIAAWRVKAELGIPATPWERLTARLQDPASDLGKVLTKCGVQYRVTRQGRQGNRSVAHLVKV